MASTKPADSNNRQSKPTHHHSLRYRQWVDPDVPPGFLTQDHELVRRQLDRALALALDAVGFDDAEPLAMESFRALAEEYMAHFLHIVHRGMCASRRRTPVPLDFVTALEAHNLTCRSLLPHLDPPVWDAATEKHPVLNAAADVQPALSLRRAGDRPGAEEEEDAADLARATARQESVLEAILSSGGGTGTGPEATAQYQQQQRQRPTNVPAGFPALPSQHTYRSRAVFAVREKDPQRIRERASEEGRLGEEALRRLAAKQAELRRAREEREKEARTAQRTGGADGRSSSATAAAAPAGRKRKADAALFKAQADDMFKELMAGLGGAEDAGAAGIIAATDRDKDWNGGLNEPINSERIYWRQAPKRPAAKG